MRILHLADVHLDTSFASRSPRVRARLRHGTREAFRSAVDVALDHEVDAVVNYHTHGKLHDILDEIAAIGVDVMSPIETGLRGDVTLAEVKARVGDRICLKGNLDDMAFLTLASEEEVRSAAEDCLAQAAEGGGYILSGTDAGIYRPEWVQSFMVMAQVAQGYRYH